MAVQFNAAGEALIRTSNIVASSADYTAMCWQRRTASSNPVWIFAQMDAAGTGYAGIHSGSGSPGLDMDTDGAHEQWDGFVIDQHVNHWYHFAYTRTGSTHRWYINGWLIGTITKDLSAVVFDEVGLGAFDTVGNSNAEIAFFREWTAALTQADIQAEVRASAAVRAANLYTDTPLTADLLDDSGNGHDWTADGTIGFSGDPAIADIPLNTVGQGATALTVPGVTNQSVYVDGVTYNPWLTYSNDTDADQVVAIGFCGNPVSGDYTPFAWLFADPNEEEFLNDGFENGSITIVVPANRTVYWKVLHQAGNFDPSDLKVTFAIPEMMNFEVGDVFISSASFESTFGDAGWTGFEGGFIDTEGGVIRGFTGQFVTGEGGDVLPTSGRLLYGDEGASLPPAPPPNADPGTSNYYLNLYSPQFELITRLLIEDADNGAPYIRTHLPTDTFYVLNRHRNADDLAEFFTVDEDGTLSAGTTFTPSGATGIQAFAVDNDETFLFYGVLNGAIYKLNLSTLVSTLFVAAVANYSPEDMLVLPDNTLVVAYKHTGSPYAGFVRRFDASGATLNTYTPAFAATVTSVDPRLGYSATDDTFRVLNHLSTGYADLRKIQASTMTQVGSTSLTPDVLQSAIGTCSPMIPTTSDSCPVVELRVASAVAETDPRIGPLLMIDWPILVDDGDPS